METKLKYIQFENGIEIISEVDISDWKQSEIIRLINPLKLFVIPPLMDKSTASSITGNQTMVLTKWIPWVGTSITIKVDKILVVEDVDVPMIEYYNSTLEHYLKSDMEVDKEPEREGPGSILESEDELEDFVEIIKAMSSKYKRILH
jgi:hypothetical protein